VLGSSSELSEPPPSSIKDLRETHSEMQKHSSQYQRVYNDPANWSATLFQWCGTSRVVTVARNLASGLFALRSVTYSLEAVRSCMYWHMPATLTIRFSAINFADYILPKSAAKYVTTLLPEDIVVVPRKIVHSSGLLNWIADKAVTLSKRNVSPFNRWLYPRTFRMGYCQMEIPSRALTWIYNKTQEYTIRPDLWKLSAVAIGSAALAYWLYRPSTPKKRVRKEMSTPAAERVLQRVLPRVRRMGAYTARTPDTEQNIKASLETMYQDQRYVTKDDFLTELDKEQMLHYCMMEAMVPTPMEEEVMATLQANHAQIWRAHSHIRKGWTSWWSWIKGTSLPK
jgi:hypothetical protein